VTPFEILEHTADVGVRATAGTLEGVFAEATRGLVEIAGIAGAEGGERVELELEGEDPAGLLVDWLSEVLWLHDSRDAFVGGVEVDEVSSRRVRGSVILAPRGERAARGTQVKAVTYHRLHVGREDGGWRAEVYLDV
jgi:SHS2 domain-containing protein